MPNSLNPYRDKVNYYAAQYGIDPDYFDAVLHTEMGGNFNRDTTKVKNKTSSAYGIGQMLTPTWNAVITKIAPTYGYDPKDFDRNDIEHQLNVSAMYLKYLKDKFGGDMDRAITAYNAGEGSVSNGKTTPYNSGYAAKVKAWVNTIKPQPVVLPTGETVDAKQIAPIGTNYQPLPYAQ